MQKYMSPFSKEANCFPKEYILRRDSDTSTKAELFLLWPLFGKGCGLSLERGVAWSLFEKGCYKFQLRVLLLEFICTFSLKYICTYINLFTLESLK